jgi:hypothetical protein
MSAVYAPADCVHVFVLAACRTMEGVTIDRHPLLNFY